MKRFILFAILLLGAIFVTQAVTQPPPATDVQYTISAAAGFDHSDVYFVAELPVSGTYVLSSQSESTLSANYFIARRTGVELQAEGFIRKYLCTNTVNVISATGFYLKLTNGSLCT